MLPADLGVDLPVLAAPMAGGPSTPELVAAAARAGSLGFLPAGYLTASSLAERLQALRGQTDRFGVNLFVPAAQPVDPGEYARYREEVRPDAERLGVELPEAPVEDDDAWADKLDVLLADPPPVVSFTFAVPDQASLDALRSAGAYLVQTVTSAGEARRATEAGVDALVVQGPSAGGHSGAFSTEKVRRDRPLAQVVAKVRKAVDLPVIAAGGIDTPGAVEAVLDAGADAAMVGTALLLAPEAGTSTPHRAALTGPDRGPTVVTRCWSGRPARALRNAFVDAHHATAPIGYPAIHHLTSPLRRAAAAAGDPELVNLWAGAGHRSTVEQPVAETLEELAEDL